MKDFNLWNKKKIKLDLQESIRQCHDGEVWIVSVGLNVGKEIDGKGENFARPVLALRRCNKYTFIGAALTRSKGKSPWYVPIVIDDVEGSVNISQIKLFDQKRLLRLVEKIDIKDFERIKQAIKVIFA